MNNKCKSLSKSSKSKKMLKQSEKELPTLKFRWFQLQYLTVYLLLMLADWLQGPNMYDLYAGYNVDVGTLFLTGFAASAIFGTFVGIYVDRWGRKLGCVLFCVLEIIINSLEHIPNFRVLLLGRILGGISTSLLFSAFESWMVSQHRREQFPEGLLASTFAIAAWGNGIMGCSAGMVAQIAYEASGNNHIGPFRVAIGLTVIALVVILFWKENYGEGKSVCSEISEINNTSDNENNSSNKIDNRSRSSSRKKSVKSDNRSSRSRSKSTGSRKRSSSRKKIQSHDTANTLKTSSTSVTNERQNIWEDLKDAAKLCVTCKSMLCLGLSQAVFEGAVYTFVFMWVKVLNTSLGNGESVPPGLVMTSFMLAMTLGGMFSSFILPYFPFGVEGLAVFTYITAALAMAVPAFCFEFHYVFGAFLVLEAMVGVFYASSGILRSKYYPEKAQSSIMNVFRVPLNLLVMLGTKLTDWANDVKSLQNVFLVIVGMHLTAALLQIIVNYSEKGKYVDTTDINEKKNE